MSTSFRFRWAAADWESYFRSPSEDDSQQLYNWLAIDKQFHVSVMDYFCNYNVAINSWITLPSRRWVLGAKKWMKRARGSILRARWNSWNRYLRLPVPWTANVCAELYGYTGFWQHFLPNSRVWHAVCNKNPKLTGRLVILHKAL